MMILESHFRKFSCLPAGAKASRHFKSITNEKESGGKPGVNKCI